MTMDQNYISIKIQQHLLRLAGRAHRNIKATYALSLSPCQQNMEGEHGEARKLSYTYVVAMDIGVLPSDLPNLMRDRQGWANLNMIPTSVD